MFATSAQLALAIVRDPDEDTYADYSDDVIVTGSSGTSVFHGNRQMAHIIYLGRSQLLDSPAITNLNLIIDLASPAGDDVALKWEIWTGTSWQDITPSNPGNDQTRNLRQSGTVQIQFGQVPAAQTKPVGGTSKMWICCRLLTPITPSSTQR